MGFLGLRLVEQEVHNRAANVPECPHVLLLKNLFLTHKQRTWVAGPQQRLFGEVKEVVRLHSLFLSKRKLWPLETHSGIDLSWFSAYGRTSSGAREKYEEERMAERNCYGLTTAPILHPPLALRVKEAEAERVKISLEEEKRGGGKVLQFLSLFFTILLCS